MIFPPLFPTRWSFFFCSHVGGSLAPVSVPWSKGLLFALSGLCLIVQREPGLDVLFPSPLWCFLAPPFLLTRRVLAFPFVLAEFLFLTPPSQRGCFLLPCREKGVYFFVLLFYLYSSPPIPSSPLPLGVYFSPGSVTRRGSGHLLVLSLDSRVTFDIRMPQGRSQPSSFTMSFLFLVTVTYFFSSCVLTERFSSLIFFVPFSSRFL